MSPLVRCCILAIAVLALSITSARIARAEPIPVRIATLAPASSSWGKQFKRWQQGVRERSHGALDLQVFYGTQQGDEVAIVGKMRTRQLDGAALTATGLGLVYREVLAFEVPGLFRDWARLDAARAAVRPELDAEIDKRGFRILDWGDVGMSHLMTRGIEVRAPSDLRRASCFYLPGDPIAPAVFQAAGGVIARPLSLPEILPSLSAGSVNVMSAPALAAEQLQWSSLLDHIDLNPTAVSIGALVISSAKLRTLPADLAAILLDAQREPLESAGSSIRDQDAMAFARLKARMTAYRPTAAEEEQWSAVFRDVRRRLRGAVFEPTFFDRVVALAGADTR